MNLDKLVSLRKEIHRHPEVAGEEKKTAKRISKALEEFHPDKIIKGIGGEGLAFIFQGNEKGKSVLIRAELDALPIQEINDFEYKSVNEGKGHKCGHDGHMTILVGLAGEIAKSRPDKGKVIILFQPAEETGEGAEWMLEDEKFDDLQPDYVFALHNIPGYKKGSVLLRHDVFSSASVGLEIKLTGKTSHAGEPEKGINPAKATADILNELLELSNNKDKFEDFVLVTIINVKLGEIAYGTSAGYAEIRATLRSHLNKDMDKLKEAGVEIAKKHGAAQKLKVETRFVEYFPALVNDDDSVEIIRDAAKDIGLDLVELDEPFRWSEDFSRFTSKFKGAMFGLGSGVDTPKVHNPDYDFPDEILEPGIKMFHAIIQKVLKT